MLKGLFVITFPSDVAKVRYIVNELLYKIQCETALSNHDWDDLKLIFYELLLNAVIHGNRQDPRRQVCAEVRINRGIIEATVTDEGHGFNYQKVLKSMDAGNNLLDEHGRGIRLAYALTDEMTFNGRGNIVSFTKKVQ